MSRKASPVRIGVFVVSAIFLFVVLLLLFSSNNFFSRNVRLYTFFDTSLNGLDIGAPVKFKGVRVGSVEATDIIHDEDTDEACASVLLKIDAGAFRTINGNRVVKHDYEAFFAEQISHGMAAKLCLDSLVTGKKFVSIDYYPYDNERFFKYIDGLQFQQMPSMRTDLDELLAGLDSIMQNLAKLDLESIGSNIDSVLVKLSRGLDDVDFYKLNKSFIEACNNFSDLVKDEKIKKILGSVDNITTKFDQRMDHSMDNLDKMMEWLSDFIRSDSCFRENLENVLVQLERMLRSIREFFDLLERNPNSIFAGKAL